MPYDLQGQEARNISKPMSKRKPLNRGKQKEKSGTSRAGSAGENPDGRPGGHTGQIRGHAGQNRGRRSGQTGGSARPQQRDNAKNSHWLYGIHPVHEALNNQKRTLHRLIATKKSAEALPPGTADRARPELATSDEIAELLPQGAVHQGLALHAAPLPPLALEDILTPLSEAESPPLLFLDQVSDPHNVGAILRSAAAFGAAAVVVQDRHAPQVTGTLAKSASGAVEHIPLIRVTNLARALETVADEGYFRLGLAGEADETLGTQDLTGKIALVLGAEGPGLRRLTRERCDLLVRLPTAGPISSLNVSNAAAVALFAVKKA